MSLASTSILKSQLKAALGPNSSTYFTALSQFVSGSVSRTEFEDVTRQLLASPNLIQLHNALIISLFDASSHQRPPTPPQEVPVRPPRKRRRIWPYQGPGPYEATSFDSHSSRLKRWAIGVGRRERERIRALKAANALGNGKQDKGEIVRERGVVLLPERGDPPGSRLPLPLSTISRALSVQYISDRINLISAQHTLGAPSKSVAPLLMLALEAKLKQLIIHAFTLTSSSAAISSITPSAPHTPSSLSTSSFDTLFTISPAVLPNKSAAALRLMNEGAHRDADDEEVTLLKDKDLRDYRWQLLSLLGERSTVKEALSVLR